MKLKSWWITARPNTLAVSIAPVLLGISLAFHNNQLNNIFVAFLTLVAAIMIQIGTNFINDYYDFIKGADDQNRLGPIRSAQSGLLSLSEIKYGGFMSFLIALIIGVYLVIEGGVPILIIGSLSLLSGYCYTGGPYPLGYNGLGDIFVFLFFGLLAVPGTYYLQTNILFDFNSILIGSSIGCIAVAILCVNNIRDVNTDKKIGKQTLAVRFGAFPVIILFDTMILLSYFFIIILFLSWSSQSYALYLQILSIPVSIKLIIDIHNKNGRELNDVLKNVCYFYEIFALLLILGIIL
jgi:1,4-dihydroxy-2-naphthoate octaprenyltransferase